MPIPNKLAGLRPLLSDQDVSTLTGVAPGTLAIWRSTGRVDLPYIKLGRKVAYKPEDVEAFLEQNRRHHTSDESSEEA
jgi:hypothetical protein